MITTIRIEDSLVRESFKHAVPLRLSMFTSCERLRLCSVYNRKKGAGEQNSTMRVFGGRTADGWLMFSPTSE